MKHTPIFHLYLVAQHHASSVDVTSERHLHYTHKMLEIPPPLHLPLPPCSNTPPFAHWLYDWKNIDMINWFMHWFHNRQICPLTIVSRTYILSCLPRRCWLDEISHVLIVRSSTGTYMLGFGSSEFCTHFLVRQATFPLLPTWCVRTNVLMRLVSFFTSLSPTVKPSSRAKIPKKLW